MAALSRFSLMLSALAAVVAATVSALPAAAVPATDMRSGRVDQSNFSGVVSTALTTTASR
jgi:hypothetical protein